MFLFLISSTLILFKLFPSKSLPYCLKFMENVRTHGFISLKSQTREFDEFQNHFLKKANDILSPSATSFPKSPKNSNDYRDDPKEDYPSKHPSGSLRLITETPLMPNYEKNEKIPNFTDFTENKIVSSGISPGVASESYFHELGREILKKTDLAFAFSGTTHIQESQIQKKVKKKLTLEKEGGKVIPYVKRFLNK